MGSAICIPLICILQKKLIRFEDFEAFILGAPETSSSATKSTEEHQSHVAELPVDVPSLPDNYSHRPSVEGQVIDLLLGNVACRGGCIAAHGMGGAGTDSCSKPMYPHLTFGMMNFQVRRVSLQQLFGRWQYGNSSPMV